jgi:hypothetical protein
MSTAQLKIDLINKIANLKEVYVIEEIRNLLDFELDTGVFQLNKAQKNRIIEAHKDGTLSEEQANKEIEEWLQEK